MRTLSRFRSPLAGLMLATLPLLANAHDVTIAVPPGSPLYGTIACAPSHLPTATLAVHLSLDRKTTGGLALAPSDNPTVFVGDVQTTDRNMASISTTHAVRYVSDVKRVGNDAPTISFDQVTDGVSVLLTPQQVDVKRGTAVVKLMLESQTLLSLRTVGDAPGVAVQAPDVRHDRLDQTVTLKLGETQDLQITDGVLHLTLKSLTSLVGR